MHYLAKGKRNLVYHLSAMALMGVHHDHSIKKFTTVKELEQLSIEELEKIHKELHGTDQDSV